MLQELMNSDQVEEFEKILKEGGKISAIKYVRANTAFMGLVGAKGFVDGYVDRNNVLPMVEKDMVAEFLQDMGVNPSDAWTYIAKQMIQKGWKK